MSDLVEKVAATWLQTEVLSNAEQAAKDLIAVVLKEQMSYVRNGDDHTDDFKEVFEDTTRDFARENGIEL